MAKQKPAGYGTMTLNDVEHPFHVGTAQGEQFCGLATRRLADGRPLPLAEYSKLFHLEALQKGDYTIADWVDFVYSALLAGYALDGRPVDFTRDELMGWFDEADENEAVKPLKEMMNQALRRFERQVERLKNALAPPAA